MAHEPDGSLGRGGVQDAGRGQAAPRVDRGDDEPLRGGGNVDREAAVGCDGGVANRGRLRTR